MDRGITFVITLLFCCWILLRGNEIDRDENWRVCTTEDPNTEDPSIKYFCGWELGDNYTRHTAYTCRNLKPEVDVECHKYPVSWDPLAPSIFCRRFKGNSTERGCYPITHCTPQRDFCGFKDLAEVRSIINSTIKSKPKMKNRQYILNRSIERGELD